jgi:hypothetical protein
VLTRTHDNPVQNLQLVTPSGLHSILIQIISDHIQSAKRITVKTPKKKEKTGNYLLSWMFCIGLKITTYAFCSGTVQDYIAGHDYKSLDQNGAISIPACGFFIILCWNFRTIYVGQEPSRNKVVVLAR